MQRNALRIFGILILTSLYLPERSHAQTAITPVQKLHYLRGSTQSAEAWLKQGKRGLARLSLLAVTRSIEFFYKQNVFAQKGRSAQEKQMVAMFQDAMRKYTATRNKTWPGADTTVTPAENQKMQQTWTKHKTQLGAYGYAFSVATLPPGKHQAWKKIAGIYAQKDKAWALAAKLADDMPSPEELIMAQSKVRNLLTILPILHHIAIGPALAQHHAKTNVIPSATKAVEQAIQAASAAKTHRDIRAALNEVPLADATLRTLGFDKTKIVGFEKDVAEQRKRANKLEDLEVASNRMPKERWSQPGRAKIISAVRRIYGNLFKGEVIKKIVISRKNWNERWESWWERRVLVSAYVGYVRVEIAAKQASGIHRVFSKLFVRSRLSNGSWGSLRFHSTIGSYKILPKNI